MLIAVVIVDTVVIRKTIYSTINNKYFAALLWNLLLNALISYLGLPRQKLLPPKVPNFVTYIGPTLEDTINYRLARLEQEAGKYDFRSI